MAAAAQAARYVFAMVSCMVTTVEPLAVLNCSSWFPSTELSSTLGRWKPFSDGGLDSGAGLDPEVMDMVFRGRLVRPVDWEALARCLVPPLFPRTRAAWVRLLYVFRMSSRMARMMMMPMTMTAIMAPELWMRICCLDLVAMVVLKRSVVLVTGEAVDAGIFSNEPVPSRGA